MPEAMDKAITDLTAASAINDSDLFVMEQSAVAKSVSGTLLKSYAENAAASQAAIAQGYAEDAADSADTAASAVEQIEDELDNYVTKEEYYKAFIEKTVSDTPIASFADGADNIPVKSLVAQITAQQSGSGDPSPDNIRPITGFTGCTTTNNGTAVATVDWTDEAGTVYGGTLNITTGLLTVTHGYMSFNGTENWGSRGSGNSHFFRLTIDDQRISVSSSRLCSHYRNVTVTTSDTTVGYYAYSTGSATGGYVQIRPENAADMTTEEWKEWLASQATAGTPVQAVWTWETPVTYQLTPTEVATLLGSNALAASTGDISVTYRADTTIVINNLINS